MKNLLKKIIYNKKSIDEHNDIKWIKQYYITKHSVSTEYQDHICYSKEIQGKKEIRVMPKNLFTALLQRGIYEVKAIGKNKIIINGDFYKFNGDSLKAVLDVQIK